MQLTPTDRRSLISMAAVVLALNIVGWGVLIAVVAPQGYQVGESGVFGIGLGLTAFLLGARHAFDADHIAIIDNTARKLVGDGRSAVGTGFWFALGHSTVVFGLSVLLALGVKTLAGPVADQDSSMQHTLGVIGTLAAGSFLIVIGLMNLTALLGIIHIWRHMKAGDFDEEALEHHLHHRGFLARIFRRTTQKITRPWHLYPAGLLMGLGFDTATQIALLVLAGGTAAFALPWYAIMVLPILFAAGMTLFDTADGVFMAQAYRWAFLNPVRKVYYNLTVTLLSVTVALFIGVLLLLQLAAEELSLSALSWLNNIDLTYAGFALVAVFVVVWAASIGVVRLARVDQRLEESA